MSDEEKRKQAASRAIKAIRQTGGLRSLSIADEVMKAHEATGIGAIQKAIDSGTLGSVAKAVEAAQLARVDSTIGAAIKAMTERNAMFQETLQKALSVQTRPYTEMIERYRESTLGIAQAMERYRSSIPHLQIQTAITGLDFARYNKAFAALNFDQLVGPDFRSVSLRLAEQMRAINQATLPKIDLDLTTNIGELLARSLAAQEALLAEQRAYVARQSEGEGAGKIEARFHRRMAYFSALITLLTFFWMIAHDLEERFEGDAEAQAYRTELVQMREAFENMSEQLEELQQLEEDRAEWEDEEAKREAEADAELASIMREIAEGLRSAEEDSTNEEDGR